MPDHIRGFSIERTELNIVYIYIYTDSRSALVLQSPLEMSQLMDAIVLLPFHPLLKLNGLGPRSRGGRLEQQQEVSSNRR